MRRIGSHDGSLTGLSGKAWRNIRTFARRRPPPRNDKVHCLLVTPFSAVREQELLPWADSVNPGPDDQCDRSRIKGLQASHKGKFHVVGVAYVEQGPARLGTRSGSDSRLGT